MGRELKSPVSSTKAAPTVSPEKTLEVAHLLPVDSLAHPIKDVPRVLGVSKATLYRMISAGKLQTRDLCGCVVVRRVDLQALVDGAPLSRKAAQ